MKKAFRYFEQWYLFDIPEWVADILMIVFVGIPLVILMNVYLSPIIAWLLQFILR